MSKNQQPYKELFGAGEEASSVSSINIRQNIERYLYYWKWFALAIVLSLIAAFLYLRYTPKQYQTTAQILLKDKGTSAPELDALKDITGMTSGSNSEVLDQIKVMKSRRLLTKVVEKHKLNQKYFTEGRILNSENTAEQSSVQMVLDNDTIQYSKGFYAGAIIKTKEGNAYQVTESNFIPIGDYIFGQSVATEIGNVYLTAKPNIQSEQIIRIQFQSVPAAVEALRNQLTIEPEKDKSSMAVQFSMTGSNPYKAENILNSLIEIYNQDVKEDSEKLAQATSSFIGNRLNIISKDLEGVDSELEQFKSDRQLNNAEAETSVFFTEAMEMDKELITLGVQLQIAQHLGETLKKNTDELLPSSVGIQDEALAASIVAYNELVLEKQGALKTMKENNPMLEVLNQNLTETKANIQNNLAFYENTIQTQMNTIEKKRTETYNHLGNMPKQEIGLRKIARQQQIVEAIYLFLLQKREEAEIKSSATVDALKIIDWAHTPASPISPQSMIIYAMSLTAGIGIPFAILFVMFLLDNKIKDQKEVKSVYSGAILGEIPKTNDNNIIQQNDRSSLSEAFRILRSNLNFVLPKTEGGKVIYITSTISGEGKTFAAINMAQVLSLTGKNVVLVGADVRAPKILPYLGVNNMKGAKGLTDLIANPQLTCSDCIINKPKGYGIDVLFSGTIPPNPAELLTGERFPEIIKELKETYDYVIVDTAPSGIVVDTQIIADYADLTLYVVRVDYLDKRLLEILTDMHQNKKLKNIAVVMNGIDYNRGYGYGYGYGYGGTTKKKWYQRK